MPAMAALLRSCPPGAPDVCLTLGVPSEASAAGSGNLYMQIRAPLDYQWVAFGTGGRMLNSNMFIVYQDGQGNVTISPRRGTFHTPPQLDTSATAAQLTLLEGSGVDEANGIYVANIVCANCNSWNGGTMSLGSRSAAWIGAWRRGDPLNSPSPSTQIVEHDGTVSFTVDLTRAVIQDDANPFLAAGSGGGSDGTGTGNGGRISDDDDDDDDDDNGRGSDGVTFTDDGDDDDMLLAAHGLLMAIVFVVAYPLGAALMPLLGRWWLHGGWQAIVFVAMWAGFGLGIQLAIDEDQVSNLGSVRRCLVGISRVG